ncbi:hypothetical protein NEUTE1DRAFT_133463 [Neurospora tetrasperma FGSC 2508]|uniref:BHLH domain-containing protein n=1 Tax=Neurospora tetrasperma (strain FGSC 2508 / ATCC MYA-4615 / P0657) TaxID=510951 RepID=F8N000_NEUT8|nr:uncharacterized protein NEUTE1DRAFT_133463 [Neurospora tetrasperma FGSC 2508]EGO52935.1 hypothetical protein NEUTE1DRAFT_133463 [Neurospora tetrasperma FGSC 2508]
MVTVDDRPRLTEEEKKQNHIQSEHKRRTQIRNGLEAVSKIVPGCENLQRSEGVLLHKLVEFMAVHMEERQKMIEELESLGEEVDLQMKVCLRNLDDYHKNRSKPEEGAMSASRSPTKEPGEQPGEQREGDDSHAGY